MSCDDCKCGLEEEAQEKQPEQEENTFQDEKEKIREILVKQIDPEIDQRGVLIQEILRSEDPIEAIKGKITELVGKVNNQTSAHSNNLADVMATIRHVADTVHQSQIILSALVHLLNNKELLDIDELRSMLSSPPPQAEDSEEGQE